MHRITITIIASLATAILSGACAGADDSDLFVAEMAISFSDDLASRVDRVDASLWQAGGIGGTALASATSTTSGSISMLRFFIPAGVAAIDASCSAYDDGVKVGHGVVLSQTLTAGQQNSLTCRITSIAEAGTPVVMPISLDNAHAYESALVSPEPAACSADFTVAFDVVVSDPDSDSFTFYVAGEWTEAKLGEGQYQSLSAAAATFAANATDANGEAFALTAHWSDAGAPGSDLDVDIWAIDPDTNSGQVLRTSTACSGSGVHTVDIEPVAFFSATGRLFDVSYSADGTDLVWACDNDFDGVTDTTNTVSDLDLMGVRDNGDGTYALIVTDGSDVTVQTVDCTP